MKMFRKSVLLVLVLLLFGAVSALAGVEGRYSDTVYSSNSATIDWSSLSISGGSLSTYGSYYSWSRSYATDAWFLPISPTKEYSNSGQQYAAVTNASSTIGAAPDYASATGSTSSSTISAIATAEVSVSGDAFAADGLAQRGQVYVLGGSTGTYTFSIDYNFLSQTLLADAGYAYGYVRAWAQLRLYNWDTEVYDHIGKLTTVVSTDNISLSNFTLTPLLDCTLTLLFDPTLSDLILRDPIAYDRYGYGQYIMFETGVDARSAVMKADNPVPIPGAVWLLGSGLLGLVGIRRFRN